MNTPSTGLEIDKVHVGRGERYVLKGVSLQLHSGELFHICGPNGTGKTTLLRVATGLLRAEQARRAGAARPISAKPSGLPSWARRRGA